MRPKIPVNHSGYLLIFNRDYHKTTKQGYIRLHRVIYEEHYKCCLMPWTDVHHINGIKDDNRIENLQALIHGEHSAITQKSHVKDRYCDKCGSSKTIAEKGKRYEHIHWRRNPDNRSQWFCHKCYQGLKRRNMTPEQRQRYLNRQAFYRNRRKLETK